MYEALPHGVYAIFREGDRFVARSTVDDEAEELESHSVDGLMRMIDQLNECLARSTFDDPLVPAFYQAWDEAGRQGRIKDPVRQVPNVLFTGMGTFFVEREQDNRPRVHRPESATILNFSRSNAQLSGGPTPAKPELSIVDFSKMRGPLPTQPGFDPSRKRRELQRSYSRYAVTGAAMVPAVALAVSTGGVSLPLVAIKPLVIGFGASMLAMYQADRQIKKAKMVLGEARLG